MTTQHTPGPWKAVYVGCGDWDLNGPVTQEDWKLASSAPDLLEALQEIARTTDFWSQYPPEHPYGKARDAIARATGQA